MATRHISPGANGEGGIGRDTKRWGEIHGVLIRQNGNPVLDTSSGLQANHVFSVTLGNGISSGSINISSLGLSEPPSQIFLSPVGKHAYGDTNIYAAVIEGSVTATSIPFELNAPTDNASRVLRALVIP